MKGKGKGEGDGDLATHPATWSASIIDAVALILDDEFGLLDANPGTPVSPRILDPMAGTGKMFDRITGFDWVGVDLEPWKNQDVRVVLGDAVALHYDSNTFDAVVTSPTYGNGMADHHTPRDTSRRISYFHRQLEVGRGLEANNTGLLHFGPRGSRAETQKYKLLHTRAWMEVRRVLKPGGLFVLNVKDFYSGGVLVEVADWHRRMCEKIGFVVERVETVPVPGLKFGAEETMARVGYEYLIVMRKSEGTDGEVGDE
jgi:SAM-dependent methyltransferase